MSFKALSVEIHSDVFMGEIKWNDTLAKFWIGFKITQLKNKNREG